MKITLKKKFQYSFELVNDSDIDNYNKLKEVVQVEAKSIRDIQTHYAFFAMLKLAFDNQNKYEDFNIFRSLLQIKAGYYTPLVVDGEEIAQWPKSINYASLKQEDFKVLCNKVRAVIMREFDFGIEFDTELSNFKF